MKTLPAQPLMKETRNSQVDAGEWVVYPLAAHVCVEGRDARAIVREKLDGDRSAYEISYYPEGKPSPGTRYGLARTLDEATRMTFRWLKRRARIAAPASEPGKLSRWRVQSRVVGPLRVGERLVYEAQTRYGLPDETPSRWYLHETKPTAASAERSARRAARSSAGEFLGTFAN